MLQPSKKLALSFACVVCIVAPRVYSGEWSTRAGVAPSLVFTDNVCLSADDTESEMYGTLTPSFVVEGKGNKANVSLATAVELNSLSDGDLESKGCGNNNRDRDRYMPRLNAKGDAVLIDQWLFFDANATSSQNEVSSFASGGSDSADRNGNTNTTYRYSVSPYISRRFKDAGDLYLRYTYDDQYNTKDIVGDSTKNSANMLLSSGASISPISVSLQGDYSKVKYSDDRRQDVTNNNSELKSAQLNAAYQFNRTWAINGFYGEEWNDFVSTEDEIDGDYWGAGLTWTPTSRTSVDVGTGDRFFGSTPWLRISHRHKRSRFSADYSKTVTYSRDIRTQGADGSIDDPLTSTSLSNSPVLDERLTLIYAFSGRRTNIGLIGSYSDQTREDGGGRNIEGLDLRESRYKQVSLSVTRPLAKMSLRGRLGWSEQEPRGDSVEAVQSAETWTVSATATRPLNNRLNLALTYRYTDRQSDSPLNEYQENRVTLTARFNF